MSIRCRLCPFASCASKSANRMILNSHMILYSAQVRLQLIFGRHLFRLQTNSRFGKVTFFVGGRQNDERQNSLRRQLTALWFHPGFYSQILIMVFNYLWSMPGRSPVITPARHQSAIRYKQGAKSSIQTVYRSTFEPC
jgi:hypothetical protein